MKMLLLFDLIWNKTVENGSDLKLMLFDGWVWTVLHLLVFLGIATVVANNVIIDKLNHINTRRRIYFLFFLSGVSSLFSYHYFYVRSFVTLNGLQTQFLTKGIIAYSIAWVLAYIIILVIYKQLFYKFNFGRI